MNIAFALQPFFATVPTNQQGTADLVYHTTSSEAVGYPATNIEDYDDPAKTWRTTTTGSAGVVEFNIGAMCNFQGSTTVSAVLLAQCNYPEVIFKKRALASDVKQLCSPNLLLWNERLATTDGGVQVSPWTSGGPLATISINLSGGPYPARKFQTVTAMPINFAIFQDVNLLTGSLTGKTFSGHVWLRTVDGGNGQLTISIADNTNAGTASATIDVTGTWRRIPFVLTLGTTTTSVVRFNILRFGSGQLSQFHFGGAQLTADSTIPLPFDYPTWGSGCMVNPNPRTGRRQGLYWLPFNSGYLTVEVPSGQTTDDGASFYSLGSLAIFSTVSVLPGDIQYPLTARVVTPEYKQNLPYGGSRHAIAGERRTVLDVSQIYISSQHENTIETLIGSGTENAFLFYEGGDIVGGLSGTNDPTLAGLFRRTSECRINYLMPEVFEAGFTLEEVV